VIHDDEVVAIRDLASNFYTTEADVGKRSRGQASLEQLKQLNPYVNVSLHTGEITTDLLANFDVVVLTDFYNRSKLIEFNNFCHLRNKPIGFIAGGELGLYGYTFVDFGPAHLVFDRTGEENKSAIIVSITNAEVGIVTCHEDKRHGFVDGDYVTFREVQGKQIFFFY
jgi:ubiquitin-activating enzyme E1